MNKERTTILIGLFFLLLANGCQSTTDTAAINSVTSQGTRAVIQIIPDHIFQTIHNFGVSGAWWAQDIGGWQFNNRQQVVNLLFDQKKGIGLSLYRYHIGAGGGGEIIDPWRNAESFETLPGVYDWSRDVNARRILSMAQNVGVNQFVAFAHSPPARLTRSGSVTGASDGGPNLLENKESDFARYLVDIVSHLINSENIPIGWLSPVYEPNKSWSLVSGQEGSHYTPERVITLTNEINRLIISNNLPTKILIPEDERWDSSSIFLHAFLDNPLTEPILQVYAVHSYDSQIEQKENVASLFMSTSAEKEIWMTEWADKSPGRDIGIESALEMALVIHEDIAQGNVTSWHYGLAVSKYETKEGLIYTNPGSQEIIETKRLWALGNFSRYIRPGYHRIENSGYAETLKVSAYASPSDDKIIVIVLNPMTIDREAEIQLVGRNWFNISIYETSEYKNLEKVYQGAIPKNYTFPARSISTMVLAP